VGPSTPVRYLIVPVSGTRWPGTFIAVVVVIVVVAAAAAAAAAAAVCAYGVGLR
jgi:hypothetical protein